MPQILNGLNYIGTFNPRNGQGSKFFLGPTRPVEQVV